MFTNEQIDAAEKKLMAMNEKELNTLAKKGMEYANDPKIQEKAKKIVEKLKQEKKLSK